MSAEWVVVVFTGIQYVPLVELQTVTRNDHAIVYSNQQTHQYSELISPTPSDPSSTVYLQDTNYSKVQ